MLRPSALATIFEGAQRIFRSAKAMSQILDFNELQASIQVALVASTKTVGRISSEDLGFQRSLNPEICSALDKQSARLLELSNKILKSSASIRELKAPRLEDVDDVENRWNGVVDIVDSLLEKTDTSLDEYSGVVRNVAPGSQKQVRFFVVPCA